MKLHAKRILFCLFILICLVGVILFRWPIGVQTGLNSLVQFGANDNWPVAQVADSYSNIVSVIIESDNIASAKRAVNSMKKAAPEIERENVFSMRDIRELLRQHNNNLLSDDYRNFLQHGDYDRISNNAVRIISESMTEPILSLSEDPFLLTSDYLQKIQTVGQNWKFMDGFLYQFVAPYHYIMIPVNMTSENSGYVDILRNAAENASKEQAHVYVAGVPVHTAVMTEKSKTELFFFSVFALIIAVLLNFWLFRRFYTLLPVVASLTVGFLVGGIALFLCFSSPHILTFVFGTSLIGLGIDYSFHSIVRASGGDKIVISRNMLHSFLTTVLCFIPLIFSSLGLLKQIAVFTIFGLGAIYLFLMLFMPKCLNITISKISLPARPTRHIRFGILCVLAIIVLITVPFIHIENNMQNLYRPTPELIAGDVLLQKLNGAENNAILMVRGKNIQNVLETEEELKSLSGDFFSLSSIVPSVSRQIENSDLIQKLYTFNGKKLQKALGLYKIPKFQETAPLQVSDLTQNETTKNWIKNLLINTDENVYSIATVPMNFVVPDEITNARIISPANELTMQMNIFSHETYILLSICMIVLVFVLFGLYGRRAVNYMIPCVFSVGLTIAILTWFGQSITFFHLLSLFIVIGISLDYTIFHINSKNDTDAKPVMFSFLTSLAGFGIFALAGFFLIRAMGITLGLGLAISYLLSLFLFRRDCANAQ